jgi:hypothetical protein
MTKFPRIEVHGEAPDGSMFVLNKLELENAKARNNAELGIETSLAMLRLTADAVASRWQRHLLNDKILVVEIYI